MLEDDLKISSDEEDNEQVTESQTYAVMESLNSKVLEIIKF